MKKTAWYDTNNLPIDMVNGALCNKPGWDKIEHSDHFSDLDHLVKLSNPTTVADMGCGAGELGRVYPQYKYTGFDLPHIIEKVGKVVNNTLNYIEYEAYNFDYKKLKDFDLIICNGFISELSKPIEVLVNIINNSEGDIILHRQYFDTTTHLVNYTTYAGLETPRSIIGYDDFDSLLVNHEIIKKLDGPCGTSILIRKNRINK